MRVETIPQLLIHALKEYKKPDAFMYKKNGTYNPISHHEFSNRVHSTALGLCALNLAKGDRISILSENRLEWAIADMAILLAGGINVPIYSTLPPGQVEYILNDAEARAIFVSNQSQLEKIMQIKPHLPKLGAVIIFEDPARGEAITIDDLINRSKELARQPSIEEMIEPIGSSDWASIIYTSGTTGDPKGAVLTHSNFISNAFTCSKLIDIGPTDTCLSFLPLSHVFERTAGYYTMFYNGVSIAYAENIDTVPQNLLEVKPTVMVSVPRLYEKMYARIMETATSGSFLKKNLFFWALKVGKNYVKEKLSTGATGGTKRKYALASKLVFSKLKQKTGGRLRFFVSGGAPLARNIAEFFYAAGLPILEGYGLTETSPVISVNTFENFRFGTVGKPVPDVEVKIEEDGEILVRGPNVMHGYFKRPDLTKEVLSDGWFHTGDIGSIDSDGFLSITDRKKDIIVTAGGKNVAPQPIENMIKTSKYVAETVLIGNKRKFISAIIVPNFENLLKFAKATSTPFTDIQSLLRNPKIEEKIASEIEKKTQNLASFEKVKKFILLDEDFSLETNELTPTLKVKRAIIEEKFKEKIDELYKEVGN